MKSVRSVFSYIWTEYLDLRSKYPNSVLIQEHKDKERLRIWTHFTQCVSLICAAQEQALRANIVKDGVILLDVSPGNVPKHSKKNVESITHVVSSCSV